MTAEDRKRVNNIIKAIRTGDFCHDDAYWLISKLEAAWDKCSDLQSKCSKLETKCSKLEAQLATAKAALELSRDWYDEVYPDDVFIGGPNADIGVNRVVKLRGETRKTLQLLSDIEGAEAVVEVGCLHDEYGWCAGEECIEPDTHKGILIVLKQKEGGGE